MLKYTIMKVRSKISYEAFIRSMTIAEFFMHSILFSLGMITLTGSLGKDPPLVYAKDAIAKFESFFSDYKENIFSKASRLGLGEELIRVKKEREKMK